MKIRRSGSFLTAFGVMFALSAFAGTAIAAAPVEAVDPVAAMNVSAIALILGIAVLLTAIVAEVWRSTASRYAPVRLQARPARRPAPRR